MEEPEGTWFRTSCPDFRWGRPQRQRPRPDPARGASLNHESSFLLSIPTFTHFLSMFTFERHWPITSFGVLWGEITPGGWTQHCPKWQSGLQWNQKTTPQRCERVGDLRQLNTIAL